jgi:hypothetical protein
MDEDYYEIMTSEEADFIIDLYESIKYRFDNKQPITLVGIGKDLRIKPTELADYLPDILSILTKIEKEEVLQRGGRKRGD